MHQSVGRYSSPRLKGGPVIKGLLALMLMLGISGCPQRTYIVDITFENHCNHSVRVTTTYSSNLLEYDSSRLIGPLQSETIALYESFSTDIRNLVSWGYTLTIDGDGGSETLGRSDILAMLDDAKTEKRGGQISSYRISYEKICRPPSR